MKIISKSILIWMMMLLFGPEIFACSGIFISTSRMKLFGLNEDFYNYNTIYRTMPGSASTYGIIGFGHSNSIHAIINENRSTIININFIERIEDWMNYSYRVYLKEIKEPFVLSRRYALKLKEIFG